MYSPADLVRAALVANSMVIMPMEYRKLLPYQQLPGDDSTLCYVGSLPDGADQSVLICDMVGMNFGRTQDDKRRVIHYGIHVEIRHLKFHDGFNLANAIAQGVDSILKQSITLPNGEVHIIDSVYRTSTLIYLGEEVNRKRQLWSTNARVVLPYSEPTVG